MTVSALGTVALGLIGACLFGGVALRLAGGLLALAGPLGLSLSGNANGILVFPSALAFGSSGTCILGCATASSSALAEWLCLTVASA